MRERSALLEDSFSGLVQYLESFFFNDFKILCTQNFKYIDPLFTLIACALIKYFSHERNFCWNLEVQIYDKYMLSEM